MVWFGKRKGEGYEAEDSEVKPRNQILETGEKETPESKEKLEHRKFCEDLKYDSNESSENNSEKNKLRPKSEDPDKGERERDVATENQQNYADHEGR